MKKYEKEYQVVQQWCINNGEYEFTDNENDNYILLKNGGQIYRYNKDTLVLHLEYTEMIKSINTLVKDPIKTLHAQIGKKVEIKDTFYYDDCVEIRFGEEDLGKVVEILGKRFGTFVSKKKHSPTSVRWLPDYEARKATFEEIKHERSYNKIMSSIDEYAKKIGKKKIHSWKELYKQLKNEYGVDVSEIANDHGVRPIHVIDDKNLYSKCFKIMEV